MSVGRTSLLLAPLALLGRAAAFFLPIVLAAWFGVSPSMDALYYALNVPTFLLVLLAAAVGTVIVPGFASLVQRAPEEQSAWLSAAATLAVSIAMCLGVLTALLLPTVLTLTQFDESTRTLSVHVFWQLLPFLGVNVLCAVVKAGCDVHGRFREGAAAPLFRAVGIIASAWALRDYGPSVLPIPLTIGHTAEVLWLIWVLRKAGVRLWPTLNVPKDLWGAAQALGLVLIGETLFAANTVVDKQFAAALPAGSVSILEYADRARLIPMTLIESSLLVVAFATWARARAKGDHAGFHRAVSTAIWWVFLLAPPVLGGMVVGREAMVSMLFERGVFSVADTPPTAAALGAFLPGVLATLCATLCIKAHVVAGSPRTVLCLGLLSFMINVVFNSLLMTPLGLVGLAWSTTGASTVVGITAWMLFTPQARAALPIKQWAPAWALAGVSGALTGLAVWNDSTPKSVLDPKLWIWAIPFVVLLGCGAWFARRAQEPAQAEPA